MINMKETPPPQQKNSRKLFVKTKAKNTLKLFFPNSEDL